MQNYLVDHMEYLLMRIADAYFEFFYVILIVHNRICQGMNITLYFLISQQDLVQTAIQSRYQYRIPATKLEISSTINSKILFWQGYSSMQITFNPIPTMQAGITFITVPVYHVTKLSWNRVKTFQCVCPLPALLLSDFFLPELCTV